MIRQLPNGKWQADFWLGKHRKQITKLNKIDLEREVRRLQVMFDEGKYRPASSIMLHDLLDQWYIETYPTEPKLIKWHEHTAKSHVKKFKHFIPNIKVSEFTKKVVLTYQTAYAKTGVANSSNNRVLHTLMSICSWAVDQEILAENPCTGVEELKEKKPYKRYLEKEQIVALYRGCDKVRFHNYCDLILETGLRPSEALALNCEDIDFRNKTYFVMDQKNGEITAMRINKPLMAIFYRLGCDKRTGPVLQAETTYTNMPNVMGRYTETMLRLDSDEAILKSGVNEKPAPGMGDFTIYGLRHTYASHLLMAGAKIEVVSKLLRHASITTTMEHYGHIADRMIDTTLDMISLSALGHQRTIETPRDILETHHTTPMSIKDFDPTTFPS